MTIFAGTFVLVVAVCALLAGVRAALLSLGERHGSVAAAATLAILAGALPTVARVTGIAVGVVVIGLAGAVVFVALRARAAAHGSHPPPWSRRMRFTFAVLFALLAVVCLTTWLWDEASTHLPLAGAVARDVWPLEHPLFPGQPLRYHPGFAVVGGVVRVFTQLPLSQCLDVVTLFGLGVVLWCIHDLACVIGLTSKEAALAVVVVVCAGGPVAAVLADGWGSALPLRGAFPKPWVNGASFPPLVVTNLFQHPQGLALPIACAALVVVAPAAAPGRRIDPRVVVAALLVLLCSRVQILVAAAAGLAVLIVVLRRRAWRDAVALGVVAAAVAVDSGFVGGFVGGNAGGEFAVGGYFAKDGALLVPHNLLAFGLSLGAPFFVWHLRKNDIAVALAVVGSVGFVVGNVVHYSRSWDIVKFFGISAFFAHFLLAAWLCRRPRAVAAALVVVSCWSGAYWLVRHGVGNGVVAVAYREEGEGDGVGEFLDAWGDRIPGHARVFAPNLALGRAGFLTPGTDWKTSRDTAALLLDRPLTERLTFAWRRARAELDDESLRALDVQFAVCRSDKVPAPLRDARRFEELQSEHPAGFVVFRVLPK